jgi:type IV pilus assembly protein PilC
MPRYVYQVRDRMGRTEAGVLTATDALEAYRGFRRDGKAVVSMREEAPAAPVRHHGALGARKVSRDDVIYFASQLAVMVDTGVPLADALDAIAQPGDSPALQAVVADLAEQVKGGTEFSSALEKYPRVFSQLFVALMRASEASGTMGQMLQRISEYMEQQRNMRRRVKGALTYPIAMVCFATAVVVGMLVFIMPRFERIFASRGARLPAPTRVLLAVSGSLVDWWWAYLLGLGAAVAGACLYTRTPAGRRAVDGLRINLPVIGRMFRMNYLAMSLRTMATMVASGISMLDGLYITSKVAGNCHYERIWTDLAEGVKEGATLSDQLSAARLIPPSVSRMIAAGERTGRLATVMNRVAGFCEEELKVSTRTVTAMIEPAMIVTMGLIVGGIALALLLPVFSISKVVAQ